MATKKTNETEVVRDKSKARHGRLDGAECVTPSAHMLRQLRCEPMARLQCIEKLCGSILADPLCQHMVEKSDDDNGDDDFVTVVHQMEDLCEKGTQFLQDTFIPDHLAPDGRLSMDEINKAVHDFKNLVAGIKYRSEMLLEEADERFLPFAEDLEDICEHFRASMSALDQARGVTARPAPVSRSRPMPAPPTPKQPPLAMPRPIETPGWSQPGRILIVDDEEEVRRHLTRELKKHGHQVVAVGDGAQALQMLESSCYQPEVGEIDLVLLDLRLGSTSGMDVLQELKKDFGLRYIPVVVVSASDDLDCIVQCLATGADDYLTKPFEPRLLQARVASCLAKRRLQKQEQFLSEQIRLSKDRANDLLYHIFPYTVAEELITSGAVKPRGCDHVAVMFCDIVGFTPYCNGRSPDEVVAHLDELFSGYEEAISRYKVEKIKTIGDCMMVTAGLMQRFDNPVLALLRCGAEMIETAKNCSAAWQVRVGIHTGPVVAGMAGNKHYAFDVWGDTVNTAARIESTAEPSTISVSEPAWGQVFQHCKGRSKGVQPLKGKASMEVFQFEGFREEV